ncbi:MAG: hypothetical protein KJ604_20775 [Gammaproteobacteria bacterium]|nr:hypothetical protein [Gammaproteobacteria bacterium]
MSDRTFNVKVSGFTPGGYTFSLETDAVDGKDLKKLVGWIDETFHAMQIQPALFSRSAPPDNGNGDADTKECPVHHVPMERHDKGNSHWYSHKVTNPDGTESWCRGK